MREIKFRGKCIQSKRWVYGYYFIEERDIEDGIIWRDIPQIQQRYGDHFQYFDVDPATVGQYTGLNEHLDGTGKEIYKGDRVQVNTLGINYENKWITGVVVFQDGCFEVEFSEPVYDLRDKCYRKRLYVKCFVVNNAIKVIGNIHEPELLPV